MTKYPAPAELTDIVDQHNEAIGRLREPMLSEIKLNSREMALLRYYSALWRTDIDSVVNVILHEGLRGLGNE